MELQTVVELEGLDYEDMDKDKYIVYHIHKWSCKLRKGNSLVTIDRNSLFD